MGRVQPNMGADLWLAGEQCAEQAADGRTLFKALREWSIWSPGIIFVQILYDQILIYDDSTPGPFQWEQDPEPHHIPSWNR